MTRLLGALTAAVAAALALTAPADADDGLPLPVVAGTEPVALPSAEQIVAETMAAVSSPEVPLTPATASPPATPRAASPVATPSEAQQAAPRPEPKPSPAAAPPTNVNVSVRVGSPGTDGPVKQANEDGRYHAEAPQYHADPASTKPDPAPVVSPRDTTNDTIVWDWNCGDDSVADPSWNAPIAAGMPSVTWVWNWDWGCGEGGAGPANVNVSIRVASPGDNGAVTQSNLAEGGFLSAPAPARVGPASYEVPGFALTLTSGPAPTAARGASGSAPAEAGGSGSVPAVVVLTAELVAPPAEELADDLLPVFGADTGRSPPDRDDLPMIRPPQEARPAPTRAVEATHLALPGARAAPAPAHTRAVAREPKASPSAGGSARRSRGKAPPPPEPPSRGPGRDAGAAPAAGASSGALLAAFAALLTPYLLYRMGRPMVVRGRVDLRPASLGAIPLERPG